MANRAALRELQARLALRLQRRAANEVSLGASSQSNALIFAINSSALTGLTM